MNITIVGGGNIGTQFAVHCAEKNNNVTIFTSDPTIFSKQLEIVNEDGRVIHIAKVNNVTNSEQDAFKDANLIFITYPAFKMKEIAQILLKYSKPGLKICIVPGTGGGECNFQEHIRKGCVVFGLQRVPSVARLVEKGKKVCATGYRDRLSVASLPRKFEEECKNIISNIFEMPCDGIGNYLNLTLTPSNPILHTTRLYSLFFNYSQGKIYSRMPLFYEDWDDNTSRLLFKCDDEVQDICQKLSDFDLKNVKSLKIHYESDTPSKLTQKIQSIKGFKGLKTPSIEVNGGYIPDLNSRYFTADFNFGLIILIEIAKIINVDVLSMKKIWNWYENIMIEKNIFLFKDYNINNYEDFINFYSL